MSKRKPRYEGPAYCDYQDLFDSITTELENLYHTLWDKRNEAPKFRMMGKQAKTAWMLWKHCDEFPCLCPFSRAPSQKIFA